MDQSLVSVMRSVQDAVSLDTANKHQEAYVQYLECTLRIMSNLLHNVRAGGRVEASREVRRHVQLGQQCLGRVAALLEELGKQAGQHGSAGAITPTSTPLYSLSSEQMSHAYARHRGPTPMELAYRQNQQLQNAYKTRLTRMNRRHADTVSLSLTLQRKMAENLAIAKAQEDALARKRQERQARLEEQAARRFHTPTGLSPEEQFQRETYKRILDFEQDNPRLAQLRRRLEGGPCEETLVNQLVQEILSCPYHPLSEMLQHQRDEIIQTLAPLVSPHLPLLSRITVPLPPDLRPPGDPSPSQDAAGRLESGLEGGLEDSMQDGEEEEVEREKEEKEEGHERGEEEGSLEKEEDKEREGEEMEKTGARLESVDGNFLAHDSQTAGARESGEDTPGSGVVYGHGNKPESADGGPGSDGEIDTPAAASVRGDAKYDAEAGKDVDDAGTDAEEGGLAAAVSTAKQDLAGAMERGSQLARQLTQDNASSLQVLRQISQDYDAYNQENMDDLFEDSDDASVDSENEKPESERCAGPAAVATSARRGEDRETGLHRDSSAPTAPALPAYSNNNNNNNNNNSAATASARQPPTTLALASRPDAEALQQQLSRVTGLIHRSCEQLQVMFIIAFQQLESPEAREQVYASLEEHIFKPVWKYLLPLFRLANLDRELHLAQVMTRHPDPSPADFAVRPKLQLSGRDLVPYQRAIEELSRLTNYYTFLSKLECVVRVCRQVCTCVTDHYGGSADNAKSAPSIGADDLLPILTYVVVRCREPSLYAECLAMEEFIHEGYLMCEEGYCLTTLQTAINFITEPQHDPPLQD